MHWITKLYTLLEKLLGWIVLHFSSFIIRRTKEEYKNIVFPPEAECSYFSVDFRLKVLLWILDN